MKIVFSVIDQTLKEVTIYGETHKVGDLVTIRSNIYRIDKITKAKVGENYVDFVEGQWLTAPQATLTKLYTKNFNKVKKSETNTIIWPAYSLRQAKYLLNDKAKEVQDSIKTYKKLKNIFYENQVSSQQSME